VRKAVYEEIMLWWLQRGVDGFRMDVINLVCFGIPCEMFTHHADLENTGIA